MKTIEIKNRFTNELIHSFTSKNATIKDALNDAIFKIINLRGADLSGADLYGANLRGADLRGAYLSGADLYGANLRGADLRGADLSDADLSGAYLSSAYLSGADLSSAYLSGADLSDSIKVPMYCKWVHGITNGNLIHIGCVKKTIEEWDLFFASDKVIQTERNTNEFKQIQAVYEAYKAYLTFLNK